MGASAKWIGFIAPILVVAAFVIAAPSGVAMRLDKDRQEIESLTASWVSEIASRDPSFVELLSRAGRAYYPRMRDLALYGDAESLQEIDVLDQLQVLFLRSMLKPAALQQMDADALLRFSIEQGFIGMDLRKHDELRELTVESDRASGRLYKFGDDERPDTGLQYFVREEGHWRIELRGELDRRRSEFDAMVESSGLPEAEVAFFILEMRLMRKIEPKDFIPNDAITKKGLPCGSCNTLLPKPDLRIRVIAIRQDFESREVSAVTIEDRSESLRYILKLGDSLPFDPRYRIARVAENSVVLASKAGEIEIDLSTSDEVLDPARRFPSPARREVSKTLLALAEQGAERPGLMAQWRNVGLRTRPQLLQQAWLTPVHASEAEADTGMLGLRVRKLVEGSFWQQLGLEEGDLFTHVNGRAIDSTKAWRKVMDIAQNARTITVTLKRAAQEIRYRTRTIEPR